MVQRTFNRAYTRNAIIILFRSVTSLPFLHQIVEALTLCSFANEGELGYGELVVLNFRRRELKFGPITKKMEGGLSSEECTNIWNDLKDWAKTLSPGGYAQWKGLKREFKVWYLRAFAAWNPAL